MSANPGIKIGNAYIEITPQMDEAAVAKTMANIQAKIEKTYKNLESLAQKQAEAEAMWQQWLTDKYGTQLDARQKLEVASYAAQLKDAGANAQKQIELMQAVTEAFIRNEDAKAEAGQATARQQERTALNARDLEIKYGTDAKEAFLARLDEMDAAGKKLYLTRINEAKQMTALEAQETARGEALKQQAYKLTADISKAAATEAQTAWRAAYDEAYQQKLKAETTDREIKTAFLEGEIEKQQAIAKTAAAQLATSKAALTQLASTEVTMSSKIASAWSNTEKGVSSFGKTVTGIGTSIATNIVAPMMGAAGAVAYFGMKSADSLMQTQTALASIGVAYSDINKMITGLKDYGVQTPYAVQDMLTYGVQYTRQAMSHDPRSNGTTAQKAAAGAAASTEALDLVKAVGNLAALGGITDPTQVANAFKAVSKIQEMGRTRTVNATTLANDAGVPIEELAQMLGFQDRNHTQAWINQQNATYAKQGLSIKAPTTDTASAQLLQFLQGSRTNGGIDGQTIVKALITRDNQLTQNGKLNPAGNLGNASIGARLTNMKEQATYGLADLFVKTNPNGQRVWTGAGAAIMGKGGLLDKVGTIGGDLKAPAGDLLKTSFDALTTLGNWAVGLANFLKTHKGLEDAVMKFGELAAAAAPVLLGLGLLSKTLKTVMTLLSPVGKGIAGALKLGGQVTGIGTKTDAQKAAADLKGSASREADRLLGSTKTSNRQRLSEADRAVNDAMALPKGPARDKALSDAVAARDLAKNANGNDLTLARRAGDNLKSKAAKDGQDLVQAGEDSTTFLQRFKQRRANANGGDSRSVGRKAFDNFTGQNSQKDKLTLDSKDFEAKLKEAEGKVKELKLTLTDLNRSKLETVAAQFAGSQTSVQMAASRAATATEEAKLKTTEFNQAKLDGLKNQLEQVTQAQGALNSKVTESNALMTTLDEDSLKTVDKQITETTTVTDGLKTSVKSVIDDLVILDAETLDKIRKQLTSIRDEADKAASKVGGADPLSLKSELNAVDTKSMEQITNAIKGLRTALSDAEVAAGALDLTLDAIAKKAPGGGHGPSVSPVKKATGGVIEGYAPGVDSVPAILSPGESVLRPEVTAALGADRINSWNAMAIRGKLVRRPYALGGVVEKLGLNKLIDVAKSINFAPDALAAIADMGMDVSADGAGGSVGQGIHNVGAGAGENIGVDVATKAKGLFDFMAADSWKFLKKVPTAVGQAIGVVGGALAPIAGQNFWNDVWKGDGNVLHRGEKFVGDMFSPSVLVDTVKNLFTGTWDSVKSVFGTAKDLVTDPVGTVENAVSGVWDLVTSEYDAVIDMAGSVGKIWNAPGKYAKEVIGNIYSTAKDALPNLNGLFDFSQHSTLRGMTPPDVTGTATKALSEPGNGSAVSRWTPQVRAALAQLGISESYTDLVLHRIGVESGGNPGAVNNWDSNAKAGHPSQGLMQTIPSTFDTYAGPYKSLGILNPMASIFAGLNYAIHRYGSKWPQALSGTQGYATGTTGAARGWAWVGEEGPELVNFGGGETVLNHTDSMLAANRVSNGYATGTVQSGIVVDAEKGLSGLSTAVSKLYEIITKAFTEGRIGSGTENSLNNWLGRENKTLTNLVNERTTITTKLKAAQTALSKVQADEASMASGISSTAQSSSTLATIFGTGGMSANAAVAGLQGRVSAIKAFQADITKLAKAGFSPDIISQVAQAGPDQGASMAEALLQATKAQVSSINASDAAIGTASDSLGNTVAKSYYAAGEKSAQALVNGLQSQDSAVVKQIENMANTIVKTLESNLRFGSGTPMNSALATLLTWLTGKPQTVAKPPVKKKTTTKKKKTTTKTTVPAYASGTLSASPGLALVGERGPELVSFRGGERVRTASETAGLLGPKYEIHIHEAKSEDTTASVLRAMHYAEVMYGTT
jgi:SLT domain-containing protein